MDASPVTTKSVHVSAGVPQVHTGLLLGSQSGHAEKPGQMLPVT